MENQNIKVGTHKMKLTEKTLEQKGFIKKYKYPYSYWTEEGVGLRLCKTGDSWEVSLGDDEYGILFNRIKTEEKFNIILEAFKNE